MADGMRLRRSSVWWPLVCFGGHELVCRFKLSGLGNYGNCNLLLKVI